MIMEVLYEAEADAGRMLTRNEILKEVAKRMRDYKIPMNFTRWRGR
jgi:predicted transcriptional regulator